MNKKLIVIIGFLIVFVAIISVYRFKFYKVDGNEHYFSKFEISNRKNDEKLNEILDKDIYKDNIIEEKVLSTEYTFLHNTESITGNIYIGTDKLVYITDYNKNDTYRVSAVKFETMFLNGYEYTNGIYVWLLSESKLPYLLYLESNDITEAKIIGFSDGRKYTNFVDISFKEDIFESGNTIFLLSETGNIYEISSGLRYNDEIISLYNFMYIYSDKTIVNPGGMIVQDKSGNSYKIKYVFDTYESNKFIENDKTIIVTENDRLIYFDENMENVYEFSKKVKDVNFDVYYPYVEGNLKITFEDDYNVNFKASCNQYFCINEFAE